MIDLLKHELAKTIRIYNSKGWSPATSTNYSFKLAPEDKDIHISKSGIDKANFTSEDFMEVDENGNPINFSIHLKPSAETGIHCQIYKLFPSTTCILHSHSVYPVLWSLEHKELVFEGFEIQKGFEGVMSHQEKVVIPVVENSQDMAFFENWMKENGEKINFHCFVIKGHGTYAWGKNFFEAKRHLETLDYLCELKWKSNKA
ncbi:MAG: methylthioribulose 1-phosphate dehydratase [Bacteroidetes bacterium]|nr:methylthioribulose 1-phosphate dehydratase [Bacteroidota bacterium]